MPKILYVIGMAVSNIVVVWLTWLLSGLATPVWMRAVYVVMCILILYMRTDALVDDVRKGLFADTERHPGTHATSPVPGNTTTTTRTRGRRRIAGARTMKAS